MTRLAPRTASLISRAARWGAVAACLLVVATTPGIAAAKSFSIPAVSIRAVVGDDGSLFVTEERTFSFEGDFTRVYWDLDPPDAGGISNVSVSGPNGIMPPALTDGRPPGFSRVSMQGDVTHVEAYEAMSNEDITFTLRYKVTGAATRWADTSELYWQCVTSNWSASTGRLDVSIRLPSRVTTDQVKAWAHGPLTGTVHIQDDASVLLSVSDLPASTFVEARVLFPAEALPQAAAIGEPRVAKILEEEKTLADAANFQREEARRQAAEQAEVDRVMSTVVGGCGTGLPILLLAIAIPLFLRFGREHRPTFTGRYFREEPADLHPALVSYLMNMGEIKDVSISAALMRLADRGAIRMEPVTVSTPFLFGTRQESTYELRLVRDKWDTLGIIDQNLLSFLFTQIAGDDTITIDEMKSQAKAKAKEFQDGINSFKALVTQEAESMGLVEESSRKVRTLAWVMAVFAGGASFFGSCAAESVPAALLGGGSSVALAVLASLMKRRSPEAADLFAKYRALRSYLKDFSRLQEAPPTSVVLWNHFLVLAVVFGIADRVIEQLRVRVPEVVADPGFATTQWWATSGPGYAAPVHSLASGFASAASVASSELSSSSGGGGGFSGGGGGGFGGGGGGGAD